jgi:MFS family permease
VKLNVPRPLRDFAFRRFWFGQTISLFGDQITMIALPLAAVLVLDAGPAQMGYLGAASLVPNLLFSLHAGALVDRRGYRRQTMIAADLGRALLLATIPLAYALDLLTITQLYTVAFLTGALSVFFFVSYNTLFVSMVPRESYVEANSLLAGSRAFSFVAGPSVGGVIVQVLSAPYALAADAVSFLASAYYLGSIHPEEPPTEESPDSRVTAGLRFIWRTPTLLASLAATATINFFNFVFFALFILYATKSLDVQPGVLGLVLGAGAIGGLIGSIVTSRLSTRLGVGPVVVLGSFLFPIPLLLVPLAGGPKPVVLTLLFLAEFGSGLGVMIFDISIASIFQALVPDRLRARFSGAYTFVNYGVRPLGSLVGGVLGSTIGLRPTLWIGAIGAIAGGLFLLPSPMPHLRTLPETVEECGGAPATIQSG